MERISFEKVEVQGFRSFGKPTVFKFPGKQGFFLLTGINKVNKELGANGVGKSTVWDAVSFTLFGKSVNGLRGPDLKTWLSDDQLITTLTLHKAGERYVITRGWKPNVLTLQIGEDDPKKATQDDIDQLIGCTYELFLFVVLQGQETRFFADLLPSEKLTIISKVLEIDSWLSYVTKAKAKADLEEETAAILKNDYSEKKGRFETLKDMVVRQQQFVKEMRAQRDQRILACKDKIDDFEAKKAVAAETLDTATRSEKAIRDKIDKLDSSEREQKAKARELGAKRDSANEDYAVARHTVKDVQISVDKWDHQELDVKCPTCEKIISADDIRGCLDHYEAELASAKEMEAICLRKKTEADSKYLAINRELNTVISNLSQMRTKLEVIRSRRAALVKEQNACDTSIKEAKKTICDLTSDKRHENQLKTLVAEKKEVFSKAQELKVQYNQTFEDAEAYRLWQKLFKDIRLWLVNKALLELSVCVNNSLIELGLAGWEVEFSVERSTKSGGISKGLTMFVKSPQQDRYVPWAVWSGGEKQRVRIAVAAGLLKLIQTRTMFSCDLEVWDEPTAHMSTEGIDDLLRFLEARASSSEKKLWLVDHRSLDFGGFDGITKLIRTGSKVIVKQR